MLKAKYKGHLLFIWGYLLILSLCFLVHYICEISTYYTGGVNIVVLFICHIFYTLNVPLWGASENDAYKFKKLSCAVCLWVGVCLPALPADSLIGPELYETWLLITIYLGVSCFISLCDGWLSYFFVGAVVSPIIWAFATHKSDAFKYVLDSLTGFMTALPNISLSWQVILPNQK